MRETIDMARESKVVPVLLTPHGEYFKFLERFEAPARADERAACEKDIEELLPDADRGDCAAAIRARGQA
jgi:hypothetical protein